MDKRAEIAKNIDFLIKHSGKTKTDIGKELNIAQSVVSRYANGLALPSTLTIIKLCKILDCTYEEILGKPE